MLGATSSSADSHAEQSKSPSQPLSVSTSYSCGSCQISFQNGQEQRTHMKEPWHVYNLKRRIASIPPVSLDEFNDTQVEKKVDTGKTSANANTKKSSNESEKEVSEDEDEDEDEESGSTFQCLFCNQIFSSDDVGFTANLEHMSTVHGMSIPDQEMVVDMQSLIGYLATEIRVWHECLYCGATKPSTLGIQNHMRDKGHCLLNLDREPELLEFWEGFSSSDEDGDDDYDDAALEEELPINLSATEISFASGKVISSRHAASTTRKASRKRAHPASTTTRAPPSGLEDAELPPLTVATQQASCRQLARREEMGMIGVSIQQRQALVLAEKKAQRSEAVARRAREWMYARAANSQKFDQLDNQMKFGKQNHKLLPR